MPPDAARRPAAGQGDLFPAALSTDVAPAERASITPVSLRPGIVLVVGLARDRRIEAALDRVVAAAPFRSMQIPGGGAMSVAMTNCGDLGWVSDRSGYRYSATDPASGRPWAPMPPCWRDLAAEAAGMAGFPAFEPDACLVNRYAPGARMGLHRDQDETDLTQPIVSVSLGLPATFLLGGATRRCPTAPLSLFHGDVLVFGGAERLVYHGVRPVKSGVAAPPRTSSPLLQDCRINLTFRRAR